MWAILVSCYAVLCCACFALRRSRRPSSQHCTACCTNCCRACKPLSTVEACSASHNAATRLPRPTIAAVSVRHFGWDEGERQRLQEQCGDTVSIAGEDGYLTVEEGRLRVS